MASLTSTILHQNRSPSGFCEVPFPNRSDKRESFLAGISREEDICDLVSNQQEAERFLRSLKLVSWQGTELVSWQGTELIARRSSFIDLGNRCLNQGKYLR